MSIEKYAAPQLHLTSWFFFLFHLFCSGIRYRCVCMFVWGVFDDCERPASKFWAVLYSRAKNKTPTQAKACHMSWMHFFLFLSARRHRIRQVCLFPNLLTAHATRVPIKKWKVLLACRQDNGDWIQILASGCLFFSPGKMQCAYQKMALATVIFFLEQHTQYKHLNSAHPFLFPLQHRQQLKSVKIVTSIKSFLKAENIWENRANIWVRKRSRSSVWVFLSHPPPLCGKMMGFKEREKEPLFHSFFPR